MADRHKVHREVDPCRRAEHGLSRVLSLNQSLVEAFTGVRRESRPESAPAHSLLSPCPAPVPRPARLGQAAYTSPLPHVHIDSPRRAGALSLTAITWQSPLAARSRAKILQIQSAAMESAMGRDMAHGIHNFGNCKIGKAFPQGWAGQE